MIFVERFLFDDGRKSLAANLDVDPGSDRRIRRGHVCHADAVIQARRKCAASHFPDSVAVIENRIMRPWGRAFGLQSKRHQFFWRAIFFRLHQDFATNESWFRQIDKKTEAGFDWIALRRKVGAVKRITDFKS